MPVTYTQLQNQGDAKLVVNGRFRNQRVSGVQRYAHEIVKRLPGQNDIVGPFSSSRVTGHIWEQTILPLSCRGRLLWCPNASGPLTYSRQVVTFHDLFPVEHPEWYSKAYGQWYGLMMRKLASSATHLIAVSEYTKSRIVRLFKRDPDDITVIHNGCHINGPATHDKVDAAAQALNLPSRRYVLSLSSMERRKNSAAILDAWATIYSRMPADLWLVLAGPKADPAVYGNQQVAAHPPRVMYTGYVPDEHLAGLYTGASLFVFPSFAEGFGFPLLEAMACGVRCITSETSSMPEVGGNVVDYVPPTDHRALARVMEARLLTSPRSPEPFAAVMERASRFSWDEAAARTHKVLTTALTAQPRSTMLRRALAK